MAVALKRHERPIRLVQFTKSFHLGGTEGQVVELLRGLPSRYQVQVSVLEEAGPLLEEVWKLGYLPAVFPLRGSVASPNTPLQIARLALWLQKNRVDVVHVHDFYSTLLVVPAARIAGCRVIVGRLDLAHWHGSARRAILSQLSRSADHVVANADAIRKMLVESEGLDPSKVTVIPNGIHLKRFDMKAGDELLSPLPKTDGAPVAVLVANMNHPVKRQEDFLAALTLARKHGRPLHGFLVGDGPRRPELQARAEALGITAYAHFLGHRQDVAAIYRRAQLGVLCSEAEGLSNAIIEGMASSLPMVVTKVGGNPELVAHGERGLVVQPNRPVRLWEGFAALLEDPERASAMGRAGRAFVERELTLERMVSRHDQLYRRVVTA
jgi:glycosyltransferase involved in cell wall biosynthesis